MQSDKINRLTFSLFFIISLLGLFVFYVWLGFHDLTIFIDGFKFIKRASNLHHNFEWVHPLFPFGYPFLLRQFNRVIGDYRMAGNLISAIAACLTLAVYYRITLLFNLRKIEALVSVLLLGSTYYFIVHATHLGTDMCQVFFVISALWVLLRSEKNYHFFFAGLLVGLGYLMRYTALVFLLATLIWLISKKNFRSSLYFILGFILGALPQLIASFVVTLNPFFGKTFIYNVALGLTNPDEWLALQKISREESLIRYVLSDPLKLLFHTLRNFHNILFSPGEWLGPYASLMLLPGILWAFLRSRFDEKICLITIWWLVYCLLLSMTVVHPRFLIIMLPLVYIFIFLMLINLNVPRNLLVVLSLIIAILQVRWFALSSFDITDRRSPEKYRLASEVLNKLGAFSPTLKVASLDPACGGTSFYNLNDPLKSPVEVMTIQSNVRKSPELFKTTIEKSGYRYIIIEHCDLKNGLEWLDSPELPDGFCWAADYDAFKILEVAGEKK